MRRQECSCRNWQCPHLEWKRQIGLLGCRKRNRRERFCACGRDERRSASASEWACLPSRHNAGRSVKSSSFHRLRDTWAALRQPTKPDRKHFIRLQQNALTDFPSPRQRQIVAVHSVAPSRTRRAGALQKTSRMARCSDCNAVSLRMFQDFPKANISLDRL